MAFFKRTPQLTVHWFWDETTKTMQLLIVDPVRKQTLTFNDICWQNDTPTPRTALSAKHDLVPNASGCTGLVINMGGGLIYQGWVSEYGTIQGQPNDLLIGFAPQERRFVVFGRVPHLGDPWALPIDVNEPARVARLHNMIRQEGKLYVARTSFSPSVPEMPWGNITLLLDYRTNEMTAAQVIEPAMI